MKTILTTKDIAKKAGVSQTTVSRVLNGHPYVSDETKERVLQVIKELDYQPNYVARSMVLQRTNTLGLIVADITNPFYGEIAKSIIDRAKEFHYNVFLCNNDNNQELQKFYIRLLLEKRVDGIIFASVKLRDKAVEQLVRDEYPCIMCNRHLQFKKASFVTSNNKLGAFMAVEHLIKLGHTRIGFISGPADISTAAERLEGYIDALKTFGIEHDPALVVKGDFKKDFVYKATAELLEMADRPTAIFASNDLTALAAMECIEDFGYSIPKDVALIGYDDISLASHKRIGLTTVAQKKEEMGRIAVEKIIEMITRNGEKHNFPLNIYLHPELKIRGTCGFTGKYKRQPQISRKG